jgi:hypothetical protein
MSKALKARIAQLEAQLDQRLDDHEVLRDYATDVRKIIESVPKRPRYVGRKEPTPQDELVDALYDLVASWLDPDGLREVFELCDVLGCRPSSRDPEDVIVAIRELRWRVAVRVGR